MSQTTMQKWELDVVSRAPAINLVRGRGMLDPQPEETPDDMKRMDLIHQELEAFRGELELWVTRTKGSG